MDTEISLFVQIIKGFYTTWMLDFVFYTSDTDFIVCNISTGICYLNCVIV